MAKHKRILFFVLFLSIGLQTASGGLRSAQAVAIETRINPTSVITTMRRMADWQIYAIGNSQDESWQGATFFDGLMALYQATGNSEYLNRAVSWGTANNWTPATPQSDPNNQNAGQAFLEMYLLQPSATQRLATTKNVIDSVMAQGGTGQQTWWWADSLFMAPPTFARLGNATGDASYFSFMDKWYWDSANYLIDPASNLFWRDSSFFNYTCPNGQKMFWSRGNAWVAAGIVRILEFLPDNHPDRPKFITLLQKMAAALAPLQRPDGYWSSCLTDVADYPEPETSGTAGLVYAMAWGINNGMLDAAKYTPVVQKGWNALVNAVQPSGALGWVQPPGSQPGPSSASDSSTYGTGLALLAGSEVAKMSEVTPTTTTTTSPQLTPTVVSSTATLVSPTATAVSPTSGVAVSIGSTSSAVTFSSTQEAPFTQTYGVWIVLAVVVIVVVAVYLYRRGKSGQPGAQTVGKESTTQVSKAILDKQFCTQCGLELPIGSQFCYTCGAKQN